MQELPGHPFKTYMYVHMHMHVHDMYMHVLSQVTWPYAVRLANHDLHDFSLGIAPGYCIMFATLPYHSWPQLSGHSALVSQLGKICKKVSDFNNFCTARLYSTISSMSEGIVVSWVRFQSLLMWSHTSQGAEYDFGRPQHVQVHRKYPRKVVGFPEYWTHSTGLKPLCLHDFPSPPRDPHMQQHFTMLKCWEKYCCRISIKLKPTHDHVCHLLLHDTT